ncbi:MAG: TetR/AcrR family transcriptional regulator [Caldilineaceae bacterium]
MDENNVSNSKEAILDAAQKLLAQHGYAGLSMRELAQESGLAKATIYHYFQDKEEIFRYVLERDMEQANGQLKEVIAGEEDCIGKLRAVVCAYFGMMRERRTIIMNTVRELGNHKRLMCELMRKNRPIYFGPITELLQQGVDEGILRPINVEFTTYSIMGMINSFVVFRALLDDVQPDEEIVEHTITLLLQGIQAQHPSSQAQNETSKH